MTDHLPEWTYRMSVGRAILLPLDPDIAGRVRHELSEFKPKVRLSRAWLRLSVESRTALREANLYA